MYFDSDSRWDDLVTPGRDLTGPRSSGPGGLRPVFDLTEAGDAVDALARRGAAIPCGGIVSRAGDGTVPPPPVWKDEWWDAGIGPGSWQCVRQRGEAWETYVARSAELARDALRLQGDGAEERAGAEVVVELNWTTADEVDLFDVPAYLRDAYARLPGEGCFAALTLGHDESTRTRWAGAVPGSFYGSPADRVAGVPMDARYVWVSGRARDLAALSERPELEVLTLSDADEAALRIAGTLRGLRILELTDLRTAALDPIAGLPALEVLRVSDAARLRDASALAHLPALRALWLDVSGLRTLDALAPLTGLRALLFTGSRTTLPTLEPLRGLAGLRHLHIGHVRFKDRSLTPLHALTGLATLEFPECFPLEEVAGLAAALPRTTGIPRHAFQGPETGRSLGWCRVCRSRDVVFTTGAPVRTLCRACDDAKIRKHALRWEMALADATTRAAIRPPE